MREEHKFTHFITGSQENIRIQAGKHDKFWIFSREEIREMST